MGNGHGLAAIMMEALQGEGGIKPGDVAFFKGIREICDRTGALMIIDEVKTDIFITIRSIISHITITPAPS